MDRDSFIQIYTFLICMAFAISVINWVGYSILAPWWKTALGRVMWTKFLSIVLILGVPFMQVMFNNLPFRYELSVGTMIFFIVALILVGYGIYVTQIKGYLTYKKAKRRAQKRVGKS